MDEFAEVWESVEALRSAVASGHIKPGRDELARLALATEIDRLRKDAERFRKIEQDFSPMGLDANGNHPWAYRRNFSLRGPTLAAAIDAAPVLGAA